MTSSRAGDLAAIISSSDYDSYIDVVVCESLGVRANLAYRTTSTPGYALSDARRATILWRPDATQHEALLEPSGRQSAQAVQQQGPQRQGMSAARHEAEVACSRAKREGRRPPSFDVVVCGCGDLACCFVSAARFEKKQ